MKLVFATHNPGKLEEMRALLSDLPLTIQTAEEFDIHEEPEEDGRTFAENALIKARYVCEKTGEWSVSDDAGLCIEALNNEPGVQTARWAGPDATDEDRIRNALEKMKEVRVGKRQATFHSVLALVAPDGQEWLFEGSVVGRIALAPSGPPRVRLPFDQLFIPEGDDRTFSEMTDEEKNTLSHRGRALRKLADFLKHFIEINADA